MLFLDGYMNKKCNKLLYSLTSDRLIKFIGNSNTIRIRVTIKLNYHKIILNKQRSQLDLRTVPILYDRSQYLFI